MTVDEKLAILASAIKALDSDKRLATEIRGELDAIISNGERRDRSFPPDVSKMIADKDI